MQVKNKIKNAFITIITDALQRCNRCERVIFATEKGKPFEHSNASDETTITYILEGGQNTSFYRHGQLCNEIIIPGKIYFRAAGCHDAIDWQRPCKRLGMAIKNDWLGMAWKSNREAHTRVMTDLWYSPRHLSSHPEMPLLFKMLAARANTPEDSPLTLKLPVLILEKMREILSDPGEETASSALHTFNSLRRYLEGNFHLPINRKTVAAIFNLNPDYVTRLFKEQGRSTFAEYLNNLRLRQAEMFLSEEQLSVNETARRCGFADTSYFIKVFRKKFLLSPKAFQCRGRRPG